MRSILSKYTIDLPREGANEGGGGGAGAGAAGGAGAGGAVGGATPWHQGQADAEMLGYWQNKGFDVTDPIKVATAATKAAIEAQKFVGVPPDQIVRLPKDKNDEAGWKTVYQRLGAPADAKDYDFSAVKHADGSAPAQSLIDAARATATALHAPKDRAADIAAAMVKHADALKSEGDAARAQTLSEQKANLAKTWGLKDSHQYKMNEVVAAQGAKRLGISAEAIALLENQIGYDGVMEAMRKIGAGTTEDTFVESGNRTGTPATVESAQQRLNELSSDPAWSKRLTNGDIAARREWQQLTERIAGVAA